MRDTIKDAAVSAGAPASSTKVVLAGLSNIYTHYITTFEEYQGQRYEAASTIYGPHTLRAYQEQFAYLTEKLVKVSDVPFESVVIGEPVLKILSWFDLYFEKPGETRSAPETAEISDNTPG